MDIFIDWVKTTGIYNLSWENLVMFAVAFFFMYLAIKKNMESYELLPIGLGVIIANLPLAGMDVFDSTSGIHQSSGIFGVIFYYTLSFWNILPPIIFLGLGAITDFTPLINNPKTFLLGAAAQIGIFVSFWGASLTGYFTLKEAASIGIIGGADGPTTIFLTSSLAPDLLGITAVIAYSYMAAVAFIQPPIMKLLTTKSERNIIMKESGPVNNKLKILFPNIAMFLIFLIVPRSAPLISMFMIGNILKESKVVPRLVDAASNELINLLPFVAVWEMCGMRGVAVIVHAAAVGHFERYCTSRPPCGHWSPRRKTSKNTCIFTSAHLGKIDSRSTFGKEHVFCIF